jgi:hypothetical protein
MKILPEGLKLDGYVPNWYLRQDGDGEGSIDLEFVQYGYGDSDYDGNGGGSGIGLVQKNGAGNYGLGSGNPSLF